MNNLIVNVDTDSIMIVKPDQSPWTKEDQDKFLEGLNAQFPEKIRWEHDGVYSSVLVIASKNYALLPVDKPKIKIKGSSLKDQKKEPAMKEMMNKIIDVFLLQDVEKVESMVQDIYHSYIREACQVQDISRWSKKIGASEAVLNCKGYEKIKPEKFEAMLKAKEIRPNEINIWDAIKMEELVQQGDKFYVYPAVLTSEIELTEKTLKSGKIKVTEKLIETYGLRQPKHWNGKDQDVTQLLSRVYATLEIFCTVLDMNKFVKYHNKTNSELLQNLLDKTT